MLSYGHEKFGQRTWILDQKTLQVKQEMKGETKSVEGRLPAIALNKDMETRTKTDNTGRYVMRWQTLPINQDRPRPDPVPAPTELMVYEIVEK